MQNKNNINFLLSNMTNDLDHNLREIAKCFGILNYTDESNQSILHILVDNKYDEFQCFLAIKSLLYDGLNPNLEDDYNYNFIQTALYAGYSENFILNIITESLKYNLNVNHVDSDKDTIVHTAIYSDNYLDEIEKIYELLCANGFNSYLKDCNNRNLIEAMYFQKQYSTKQINNFKKKFHKNYPTSIICKYTPANYEISKNEENIVPNDNSKKEELVIDNTNQTLSNDDVLELEKYGKILNNKDYMVSPTIGREKELKNVMITLAQKKKSPLIIGEDGVGKTAIVDELAYRIKTGQVPNFLKERIILEVNPSNIVAGCQYVGMFEENMTKLMELCVKLDIIVFIDEIHTIYGIGSSRRENNDMSSLLKHYIDRSNLKVIGITNKKEYSEFFSNNSLKGQFETITIKEPKEDILYQIIDKVIDDYCKKDNITFENENIKTGIIDILVWSTEKNHRVYYDIINNPDLSISIVDKAFAIAKIHDSNLITEKHFIECFECCDRIYKSAKEEAIERLRNLDKNVSKPKQMILKINFNK